MSLPDRFLGFLVSHTDPGCDRPLIWQPLATLPLGEVLVRVHYSWLNYQDGLSVTGQTGVTRNYPDSGGSCRWK